MGYGAMSGVTYTLVETERGVQREESRTTEETETEQEDDGIVYHASSSSSFSSAFVMGLAFWVLGLLNNTPYVIMIASAKTISEGGTGLVFLANVVPSLAIKISAPYWFDWVSYQRRMVAAFGLMVLSFGMVASLSTERTAGSEGTFSIITICKLLGVAMASSQCGLGEASLLAAAGKVDTSGRGVCITCFSSGTGLAGVFGFLWKFVFNERFHFSMATTLWLAQSLALAYITIFIKYLHSHLDEDAGDYHDALREEEQPLELTTYSDNPDRRENNSNPEPIENTFTEEDSVDRIERVIDNDASSELAVHGQSSRSKKKVHEMTAWERTKFFATLWPYVIPLFVVYLTEYSLQAGTWTAIGFPVNSKQARDEFYEYSNWMVCTALLK